MGYTTYFNGEFLVNPVLKDEHREYLVAFNNTRRMARDEIIVSTLPDPIREAAGLPVGYQGAYFVGGGGFKGQGDDVSVIDHNEPPGGTLVDWAINVRPLNDTERRLIGIKSYFYETIGIRCPKGYPHDHVRPEHVAESDMIPAADPPHGCKRAVVQLGNPEYAQPGLWCQWVPSDDGSVLVWDEGEKFYDYVPWLVYLIDNFLEPWGYVLTGNVTWSGEDDDDRGLIRVEGNAVYVSQGVVEYLEGERVR